MADLNSIDWHRIARDAGGFRPAVFDFIREGLEHTARMIHGPGASAESHADETRHVTGAQLCLGLRDLAVQRYGAMARTVLEHWNVRATEDFGRIVFALIEAGVLRDSPEDSYADFVGVYEFDEAFAEAEAI
ncbi:MAG: Minf_1886 family protein [Planctomycetota bacterium]